MKTYRIVWNIELEAESPLAAAQAARRIQLNPESTATVYTILDEGVSTEIDLMDEGERKDYATELRKLRIYDNGGKTFDRYTAVFMDRQYALHNPRLREALGFSSAPFAPQGFGQHTSALPGRHLGKRIALEDLNADCQQFIKQNL